MDGVKRQASALPVREATEDAHPYRICFFCSGNTCRSPMAEALANAWAKESLEAYPASVREAMTVPFVAVSAGLYASEGTPIASEAVAALERAGVKPVTGRDYHDHTATAMTDELIASSDLLVGMTNRLALELMLRYPEAVGRITCMPEGISDPFGGDGAVYSSCLAQIERGLRTLLTREALL